MDWVMERWQDVFRSRRSRDVMVALVIAGPAAIGLLTGFYRTSLLPSLPLFAGLTAACAVVVGLWRREHDWAAALLACATFVVTDLPYANYVMTYSLARRRRWPLAGLTVGLLLVWPLHQTLFEPATGTTPLFEFETSLPASGLNGLVYWSFAAVSPFVMGLAKNSLEAALMERERHAKQSAERQRRLRESTLRERSLTERARLASMMHDGVGHHVSVMVTTAGAISVDPAATGSIVERCDLIVGVGREAISRLGEVLDVLAAPAPESGDVAAEYRVDDIADLVGDYRSLGVEVAYAVEPVDGCDPATQDLCYRIVREALTNVLRHAAVPRADIRLTSTADRVHLAVSSPLAPADRATLPGTGRGLRLLADEAALAGGTLTATPSGETGRFVLRADLPRSSDGRDTGEAVGPSMT
ncbi:histidine kinase [Saccharothrix sp.]|uniref:sensor histidine kinase n=1 Tax=Saccharothrix sp. TaxID=1873460 RepID=UPI0028113BDF|nr:histidine kinase [Saccharothrix sp.]